MNLHEQLGALEVGVDQLIQAVVAPQAQNIPETPAATAAPEASRIRRITSPVRIPRARRPPRLNHAAAADCGGSRGTCNRAKLPAPPRSSPRSSIGRPAQNEITMTIGGKTVVAAS